MTLVTTPCMTRDSSDGKVVIGLRGVGSPAGDTAGVGVAWVVRGG